MPKTREQIDTQLADLERQLPDLIKQFDPGGDQFFEAFGSITETITESAGENEAYAHEKIQCLLGSFGLIPSDNEGEPCVGTDTAEIGDAASKDA